MSRTIRSRLRELKKQQEAEMDGGMDVDGTEDKATSMMKDGPAVVPALLRALCHINRFHPTTTSSLANVQASATGQIINPDTENTGVGARVLIVNNTPERGSGGYVGLMNSVFAAQKRKIPIDVVNLYPTDSIFLQQAAHLTHGIYFKLPKRAAFLIYLNLIFLPPPHMRNEIGLPPQDKVDFRAVCFCHQRRRGHRIRLFGLSVHLLFSSADMYDLQIEIPNCISPAITESPPRGTTEVAEGEWGKDERGVEEWDAGGGQSVESAGGVVVGGREQGTWL